MTVLWRVAVILCLSKNLTKYVATTPLTMPVTIVKINNSINVTLLSTILLCKYFLHGVMRISI